MTGRAAILAGALLCWAAAAYSAASYRAPFPPPSELSAPAGGAGGDMLALALGARRVFADLWFVRLMQYYGSRDFKEVSQAPGHAGHVHRVDEHGHHHCDHGKDYGKGAYPLFLPITRHILAMDPQFTAAGLYGAASLAFNLERGGEAEELLRYGLRYSPREWKYLSLLAAVGYSKAENPAAVAATIAPLLKGPDCPVMLKQLAAFLNKKAGNFAAAAAIYADIAATSRDEFYIRNAQKELARFADRGLPSKQ
jgi:hypothetical protein